MSTSTPLWEVAFAQQMLELSVEDVEELRSERTIKQSKISTEELQKLTVNENLNSIERLNYILIEGEEVQKINALHTLPDILLSEQITNHPINNLLKIELTCQSKDILLACFSCITNLLEKRLIDGRFFETIFIGDFLQFFKGSRDKEIVKSCVDTLQASLDILPKNIFENQLLDFILYNSSLTSFVLTREACCWIIGFLSKYLTEELFLSKVIPVMKLLCQDVKLDVRSIMCQQLPMICNNVKREILVGIVLPELYLLFQDEETIVRQSALSALCNVLHKMEQDELVDTALLSLIIKFFEQTLKKGIDGELSVAARYIGEFYHTLQVYFSQDEKTFLMDCYQKICCHGIDENNNTSNQVADYTPGVAMDKCCETRFWSAYNLPAMLLSISPGGFKSLLLPSLTALAQDDQPIVRRCIAASLHEVAKVLSKDEVYLIQPVFTNLLQDKDVEVLGALMNNLSIILECLATSTQYQDNLSELFPLLLSCENYISLSLRWRVHVKLLDQLSTLHKYVDSDEIYTKLVPVLFEALDSNKVLPVQHASSRLLLNCMSSDHNVDERNTIHATLIKDFAQSDSCRKRLLFLDLCQFVPEYFSKSFFKEYFYDFIMALSFDSIINVRIKFCNTLVLLKSQINLPCDRLLLQVLEQTVRRIMALENDPDVSSVIRKVIVDLDGMSTNINNDPASLEYLIDQEKQQNEENILESHHIECEPPRKMSIDKGDSIKRPRNNSFILNKDATSKKVASKSSKTNTLVTAKQSGSRSKDSALKKSTSLSSSSSSGSRTNAKLPTVKKSSSHGSTSKKPCK